MQTHRQRDHRVLTYAEWDYIHTAGEVTSPGVSVVFSWGAGNTFPLFREDICKGGVHCGAVSTYVLIKPWARWEYCQRVCTIRRRQSGLYLTGCITCRNYNDCHQYETKKNNTEAGKNCYFRQKKIMPFLSITFLLSFVLPLCSYSSQSSHQMRRLQRVY